MDKYVNLKTKLQLCKNSNIKYIQKNEIDEINNVSKDTNLPKVDRIMNFLDKVKNPYMFIINGMKVKMEFTVRKMSKSIKIDGVSIKFMISGQE